MSVKKAPVTEKFAFVWCCILAAKSQCEFKPY